MTKKILLIDDEPDVTYTIKSILEEHEFKVYTFTDSILALDNYKVNFYDLIILDILMPKMDGYELYTKLREKDSPVKICFLTAITTFNEDFRKIRMTLGKTINEDYFIQKPIKTEELVKKITSIINLK
ncbi:MAG TPA: response regulator [Nitrososphaeraceae archaeon]|nr:response regulator [Nitrososphaeraceae archaeon]